MFGFFSRKYSLRDTMVFDGFTDCHSHILPGVDDGIRTMRDALDVLDTYAALGVKQVWLTPHIMEDIPNTTDKLRSRFAELQEAYAEQRNKELPEVQLSLMAENMIDGLLVKRLADGDVLPYGNNGKELLLETSYVQAPYGFQRILLDVQKAGYTPVLAHPERYMYMGMEMYDTLRSQGVSFQMNLFSLLGGYGKEAKKRAEYLLENNYYSYSGTDIHNLEYFKDMIDRKILKGKVKDMLAL